MSGSRPDRIRFCAAQTHSGVRGLCFPPCVQAHQNIIWEKLADRQKHIGDSFQHLIRVQTHVCPGFRARQDQVVLLKKLVLHLYRYRSISTLVSRALTSYLRPSAPRHYLREARTQSEAHVGCEQCRVCFCALWQSYPQNSKPLCNVGPPPAHQPCSVTAMASLGRFGQVQWLPDWRCSVAGPERPSNTLTRPSKNITHGPDSPCTFPALCRVPSS